MIMMIIIVVVIMIITLSTWVDASIVKFGLVEQQHANITHKRMGIGQ